MNNKLDLTDAINTTLKEEFAIELKDSKKIADHVLKLSDFYIKNPQAKTPWSEKYTQIAYLSYYLPLNYLRVQKIVQSHSPFGFFDLFDNIYDFGSGLGSATLAILQNTKTNSYKIQNFEISTEAQNLHQKLLKNLESSHNFENQIWLKTLEQSQIRKNSLLVCSYSLTEQKQIPKQFENIDHLFIIEPGTEQDGRQLLNLRQKLIDQGYYIWGPCTHQKQCPLLNTKSDWCHDRVMTSDRPNYLVQIEKFLPIKNNTLTMSYLTASKKQPPQVLQNKARVTGDMLEEKGKNRIMICQNNEREFLAWLTKDLKNGVQMPDLKKGDLIEITSGEKVSNEIRNNQVSLIKN